MSHPDHQEIVVLGATCLSCALVEQTHRLALVQADFYESQARLLRANVEIARLKAQPSGEVEQLRAEVECYREAIVQLTMRTAVQA